MRPKAAKNHQNVWFLNYVSRFKIEILSGSFPNDGEPIQPAFVISDGKGVTYLRSQEDVLPRNKANYAILKQRALKYLNEEFKKVEMEFNKIKKEFHKEIDELELNDFYSKK